MVEEDSVCELLYSLRDAVADSRLEYALMLSREVHDRILHLIHTKKPIDCRLNCDKHKE